MKFKLVVIIPILILMLMAFFQPLRAQDKEADSKVLAETILKLVSFEKHRSSKSSEITVYVLGADDVAKELNKMVGMKIGRCHTQKGGKRRWSSGGYSGCVLYRR